MTKCLPIKFSISTGACIWGCLLILLAPIKLVFSFYAAAVIHELFHILVLRFFQIPVFGISLGISTAQIQTGQLNPEQEFFCAAAGPFGSFLCLLFLRSFPLVALSGFIQGIYNLLPIYPMDGGRMLRCISLLWCPIRSDFICNLAEIATIGFICSFCIILHLRTSDRFYLIIPLYFLLQTCAKRKIPCKEH